MQRTLEFESRAPVEDRARIAGQTRRLLERLQAGPVTNVEIVQEMKILNGTGRISDLRRHGFKVVGKRMSGGLWQYRLLQNSPEKPQDLANSY